MSIGEFINTYREVSERVWKEVKYCSECSKRNDVDDNYCVYCGHKLKRIDGKNNRIYCSLCGNKNEVESEFCGCCGCKIEKNEKIKKCAVCGEWIGDYEYCNNCGHNTFRRSSIVLCNDIKDKNVDLKFVKKCPNCNMKFQKYFNYCEYCGTKLEKR